MTGIATSPVRRRRTRKLIPALFLTGLAALGACAPAGPPAPPAPPPLEAAPSTAPALLDRHGRMIVEAMEYPWSALGRLNTGGRGFCTGILIGPRLVMSPAHCLYYSVEGRWRTANELHFVAGYQRDAFIIHSGVAGYEVAPEFTGGAANSLANAAADWALVTLEAPIGLQAGWLALQRPDREIRARLALGEGLAVQAGYRRGWDHSMTVKLGCLDHGQGARNSGSAPGAASGAASGDGPCGSAPASPELPYLMFLDGEARAVANPLLLARAEAGRIAVPDFRDLTHRESPWGATWGRSRPPDGGGPAARAPATTVMRLLAHLGYLDRNGPQDGKTRDAAIRNAERAHGLPQTGRPAPALLAKLLAEARQDFLPPPKVSMLGDWD